MQNRGLMTVQQYTMAFAVGGVTDDSFSFLGNYYIIVMAQVIFIQPLLLVLYRKFGSIRGMVFVCGFVIAFEIFVNGVALESDVYRLISVRYIPYVYSGIIIYENRDFNWKSAGSFKRILAVGSLIFGAAYLLFTYYGLYSTLIFKNWTKTAFPALLWIFPFVSYILWDMNSYEIRCRVIHTVLSCIGKASFHVFLAQGFYFKFFYASICTLLSKLMNGIVLNYVVSFANLMICIVLGVLLFYVFKSLRCIVGKFTTKYIKIWRY